MKVLITGGAGYIGGALTNIIKGHEVLVYDSLVFEDSYMKDVPFVKGDIDDRKTLKKYLEWADCVVWLAAIVGDGACAINPNRSTQINQESVKWLSENFGGRIIFMSTCSVYGAQDGLLTEDSPTNPLSVYASTKLEAEKYLRDKNAIVFRLGTLFGVGDRFSRIRTDLVVNTMTARAFHEGSLKVFGGEQYRPLLHVKDAAQAIADSIDTNWRGIFNLHHTNTTMLSLANKVNKLVGGKIEVVETSFEDSRNYKVDSDKARNFIGFDPKYDPEYGIKQLHLLLKQGRIKDINNPRYSNQGYMEMTHVIQR